MTMKKLNLNVIHGDFLLLQGDRNSAMSKPVCNRNMMPAEAEEKARTNTVNDPIRLRGFHGRPV